MDREEKKIAVYSRKSKFTGKGESIDNQTELCREFIRQSWGERAEKQIVIYEDEGFSGGSLNRPDFQRMMNDARGRALRAVVVYRLDRISRNISDFANLIEELSRLEIAFVSIREQFDTGTPMGRAMMYIASVFSQLERETIAERIRDNMHELAKTGRWLGGTTPTGYDSMRVSSVTVDGKTKRACQLVLIPQEAQMIRTIFRLFEETQSLTGTEAELLRQNMRTKNGREFTRFSIRAILQNPVYLTADEDAHAYFRDRGAQLFSADEAFDGRHGVLAYNRTRQEKGKSARLLPVQEWIVAVGQHEGMIDGKQWVRVQELLECNQSKEYRRPRSNEALLTGVLYCSCESRMYPKLSGRKTKDGKAAFRYVCKRKERSRRALCDAANVDGNALDAAVLERAGALEQERESFLAQMEENRRRLLCEARSAQEQTAFWRQEESALEQKMSALIDLAAELTGEAREGVLRRMEELQEKAREAREKVRRMEAAKEQTRLSEGEADRICGRLADFRECLAMSEASAGRTAMQSLRLRIIWDGVQAHLREDSK